LTTYWTDVAHDRPVASHFIQGKRLGLHNKKSFSNKITNCSKKSL